MEQRKHILFTKQLSDKQTSMFNAIDSYDFITIEPIPFEIPKQKFKHLVFTSKNAVDAFSQCAYDINSIKSAYVVGEKTKEQLQLFFPELSILFPKQENAEGMIELMERDGIDSFLFFCGKKRLALLENYFIEKKKTYQIVEVYDTLPSPPLGLDVSDYKIICFASPSAVKSYLQEYLILPQHTLLSIGETTAQFVENYTKNSIVSPTSSIEGMLYYLKRNLLKI